MLDDRSKKKVIILLKQALKEDIGINDITTDAIIPRGSFLKAQITAKSKGIIAGIDVARQVFEILDNKSKFTAFVKDGTFVKSNTVVAVVEGRGNSILKAERVALNFMQRMSAVATQTYYYVLKTKNTKAKILDTRKTMPGLRIFDKWAVRIGGGHNHRLGLYDMILIKDNHIAVAKSITNAVKKVRNKYNSKYRIEIEVRDQDELNEAIGLGPDRILLDNMNIKQIIESVKTVKGNIPLEVSGVKFSDIQEIAQTGVDYISVGALTHSANALDISLECLS